MRKYKVVIKNTEYCTLEVMALDEEQAKNEAQEIFDNKLDLETEGGELDFESVEDLGDTFDAGDDAGIVDYGDFDDAS